MLIALNKPFNVLSQFSGEERTLKDYLDVPGVYPAGRLDKDSEGLLLLTDDGALQARISSPKFKLPKTYYALVERTLTGFRPLRPRLCSIYDPVFWRQERLWKLPDTHLQLPALTAKDDEHLQFAACHADMIGLSFANHESDVQALIERLQTFDAPLPGIVLKIETRRGFERLPSMLLTAMRHASFGVMIARGDLAVECGYERLAEVQEEILWLCEAAHCPAIWATQVLETLAKQGTPSRAEITDAAMGHRAECVMLNKGPHINEALRVLDDILKRMDAHQSKKRAMLRALKVAGDFDGVREAAGGRALPIESGAAAP